MSQQLAGPAMPLGPDRSEYFEALVTADASGEATADERAQLEAAPERWQAALEHLLDDTEEELGKLRRLPGPERSQVVADFEAERDRLAVALARLTGAPISPELEMAAEPPRLQASWAGGELVVWVGGPTGAPVGVDELRAWLAEAEAPDRRLGSSTPACPCPAPTSAPALAAPLRPCSAGWPTCRPRRRPSDLGASVRWVAELAIWAVELVAQGRMVPQLSYRTSNRGSDKGSQKNGSEKASPNEPVEAAVQWVPALVDAKRLGASGRPAARRGDRPRRPSRAARRSPAACSPPSSTPSAASVPNGSRLPAPPPGADLGRRHVRGLPVALRRQPLPGRQAGGGRADPSPRSVGQAGDPGRRSCSSWSSSTRPTRATPGSSCVSAAGIERQPVPLDRALVTAPSDKRRHVETELARLERHAARRCCAPAVTAAAR